MLQTLVPVTPQERILPFENIFFITSKEHTVVDFQAHFAKSIIGKWLKLLTQSWPG